MFIGKVRGAVIATQKEPGVGEAKLLVVEAYSGADPDATTLKPTGRMLVAIDMLGAGPGEIVLVTQGSSARLTERTKTMPVDAVIIGIVDEVKLRGNIEKAAQIGQGE